MARTGIVFGLLLCVLAGAGLTGSPARIPSLVFPMMLGIPILFCGVVGLNPHRRKLSMLSAAIIGAFGSITGGGRAIYSAVMWSRGESVNMFALKMIAVMAVLCFVFVVAYLVSLWQRKKRNVAVKQ